MASLLVFGLAACPAGPEPGDISCLCDAGQPCEAGAAVDATQQDAAGLDLVRADHLQVDVNADDLGQSDVLSADHVETTDAGARDVPGDDAGSPPTLNLTEAFFNDADKVLAFHATGIDDGRDLPFGRVQFYDASGSLVHVDGSESLTFALLAPVCQLDWTADRFALRFDGRMPQDLAGVSTVRLVVIDAQGVQSRPAETALSATPVLGSGQPCDLMQGFSRCGENLRCALASGDSDATCLSASAASIASAQLIIGSQPATLALRVMGHDDEDDVAFAEILLLDEAGEALPTVDVNGLPHTLGRLQLSLKTQYTDHDLQAVASVRVASTVPLDLAQRGRLWLVDAAGLKSAPFELSSVMTPESLQSAARCDPLGGFNRCVDGEFCANPFLTSPKKSLYNPTCYTRKTSRKALQSAIFAILSAQEGLGFRQ